MKTRMSLASRIPGTEKIPTRGKNGKHDPCDSHIHEKARTRAHRRTRWLACPITFDDRDYPTNRRHGGSAALVLDPIIDGYHLTRVLMDGGSSLNLIYQDTVRRMGIDPSSINHSNTTFEGVIPGVKAHSRGSLVLEVIFGSPGNFRSEKILFAIAPLQSGYHALLGRTAVACFNAVPHYAYLKLKMPGPRGVITVNGSTKHSLRAEEYATALAAGL